MQKKADEYDGHSIPMLPLPKKRPLLVEDAGGGGLWICDAVGARDWRMLYVRCIVVVVGEWFEGWGGDSAVAGGVGGACGVL